MQDQETWRPIAGHAGYEVSDLGRVRSLDRVVTKMQRGRPVQHRLRARVLRQGRTRGGYLTVSLARHSVHVHCLVLRAFVGPRPAGHQAAHRDGNKLNNSVGNLRWATPRDNNKDKIAHGTRLVGAKTPNGRKTRCPRGHGYDDANTRRTRDGRRCCRICLRDQQRRYRGIPPWRFREAFQARLSEALRLVAGGISITQAARIAGVGRHTLGRARRSGTHG
jgi:HNH endonuclease/NUMOD4 motif-containing protein